MDFEGGESDEAEEGDVRFLVTDGKTSVFLDFSKEHLDAPSPFVDRFVINDLRFPVFASGDDRNIVVGSKLVAMSVAVVAHIFNDVTAENLGCQRIGHCNIRYVAAGQLPFDNAIIRRRGKMQFCRYARAIPASGAVPPFEPPP